MTLSSIITWAGVVSSIITILSGLFWTYSTIDDYRRRLSSANKEQEKSQLDVPKQLKQQKIQKNKKRRKFISASIGIIFFLITFGILLSSQFAPEFLPGPIDAAYSYSVNALAWSPDGKSIATASFDGVRLWNVTTKYSFSIYQTQSTEDAVEAIEWSPNGKLIAFGGRDTTVQIWSTTSRTLSTPYLGHSDWVNTLAWSPDGKRIASGGKDGTVQIWDAITKHLLVKYSNTVPIDAVTWSRDGKYIAFAGDDGEVYVGYADMKKTIANYLGIGKAVLALAWSPTGPFLASAGRDAVVRVWDTSKGYSDNPIETYTEHSSDVNSLSWSPDGKDIVSGSNDGTIRVWEALTGNDVSVYDAFQNTRFKNDYALVTAVGWSSDGKSIAFGDYENRPYNDFPDYIAVKVIILCRAWCFFH